MSLHAGGERGVWKLEGKAGLSIPIGKTEENPFLLGRLGLQHQHVQMGTGTWDPILEIGASRPVGPLQLQATGVGRWALMANGHAYEAGDRYALILDASHWLDKAWGLNGGLTFSHEDAETWGGRIETEGNLGRTDLFVSVGLTRTSPAFGSLHVGVQVPASSHAHGEQMDIPVIGGLTWSR